MNQSTAINLRFDMMPVFDHLAKGFYHQWIAPQLPKGSTTLVLLDTPRIFLQNWRCNFSPGVSK